jgi:hypothetical protein
MRRVVAVAMAVVLAMGAGALIGAKRLDEIAAARPVLAVRSAGETYFIPTEYVRSSGLRVQLMRLAGCWDARDGAYLEAAVSVVDCRARSVALTLPAPLFGETVAAMFRAPKLNARFWPAYVVPSEDLKDIADAMRGEREWAGRQVTLRADWKLWRVESTAGPWVFLLSDAPKRGDFAELSRLYAGRCYRPERIGDAGMTCDFVLRVGTEAAVEFSLGADEMMSFASLRDALLARVGEWRREPAVALSGSFGPSA